jgi:hypothetical protein
MRSAACVIWGAVALVAAHAAFAAADDTGPPAYRAVIDRVDLDRASIGGFRLRVELSALTLQGQLLDLGDPKSIKAMVGGSKLDAPYAHGFYAQTSSETAIVFAIQANLAYAEVLQTIATSLDDTVLSKLGERTQVAILAYGEATEAGKLGTLKAARGRIAQVAQDGSAGEPALLDTLDRAMRLLKKAKPQRDGAPLRRVIVVIGDGRDRSGDRDRTTKLGVRADKDGIRIHSFGFAPSNVRRPLLTLGELSRQSQGTFRWVRTGGAESWTPAFQQLRDEINKQHVLTYFLPGDAEVAGKRLKIVLIGRTEATSKEMKIPEASCGRDPCAGYCVDEVCAVPRDGSERGALGSIVLLGAIGFLLQRRQGAPPMPGPGLPGQPGTGIPGMPGGQAMPGGPVPGIPMAGMPGGQAMPGMPGAAAPPVKSSWFRRNKPPQSAPPPVIPAGGPALLVLTGPRAGQRIPLLHGFTIGKAPTSHLVLDDGYTSGQHAQVAMDPLGNCRLYDRGSTNGTFVNGVRVTEVSLDHGMSVRIGSTELRFLAQ